MSKQQPTVLLLFAGGLTAIEHNGVRLEICTERDVRRWIAAVPELSLLAIIKPIFLASGVAERPQVMWQSIAETIVRYQREVDGVVVLYDVASIPYAAASLTLMLQGWGKPVILTGGTEVSSKTRSPFFFRGEKKRALNTRANLVNAVQVAILDCGEVAVLFGNKLFRGSAVVPVEETAVLVLTGAREIAPIGRIDFGFRLESHRKRRCSAPLHISTNMRTRILNVRVVPGMELPTLSAMHADIDGIFVTGALSEASTEQVIRFCRTLGRALPIAYHGFVSAPYRRALLSASRMTEPMAIMKFAWVLAQKRSHIDRQALLDADLAGERFTT